MTETKEAVIDQPKIVNNNNNTIQQKNRNTRQKKKNPCNMTRIKSRNFLTNISYNKVKKQDLFDRSFVFDIYILATKNINSFS